MSEFTPKDAYEGLEILESFVCNIRGNDIQRTHSTVALTSAAQTALGAVLMEKFRSGGLISTHGAECRLDLTGLIQMTKPPKAPCKLHVSAETVPFH